MTAAPAIQHYEVPLALRIVSVANSREHWASRRRRELVQCRAVDIAIRSRIGWGKLPKAAPSRVTFIRVGPRQLDTDNLAISCKHLRDLVAFVYGVDDSPSGPITWAYEQRIGKYGIVIRITLSVDSDRPPNHPGPEPESR